MVEERDCGLPVLKTCCWYNSLRVGAMYIGILCMVGALNDFIFLVTQLDVIEPLLRQMVIFRDDRDLIKLMTLILCGQFLAVWFIISAVLFFGAYKRNKKCVVPWMVLCTLSLPLFLVCMVAFDTLLFLYMSPLYGIFVLMIGIMTLGLSSYFLLVVYSFYKELDEHELENEREKGPFISHPYQF